MDERATFIETVPISRLRNFDVAIYEANIYFYRANAEILYIGASIDAQSRARVHLNNGRPASVLLVDLIKANSPTSENWKIDFYYWNGDIDSMLEYEKSLILEHKPLCNRMPIYRRPMWPRYGVKYPANSAMWSVVGWYQVKPNGGIWRRPEPH